MNRTLINFDQFYDRALRECLLHGRVEFTFPVNYTERLRADPKRVEREIQEEEVFEILECRHVREGGIKVPRPSLLGMSFIGLRRKRPEIEDIHSEWTELRQAFSELPIQKWLETEYTTCLSRPADLRSLARVLSFLLAHRAEVKGLYPRQIAHGESTKLIGSDILLLRLFELSCRAGEPASSDWSGFYEHFGLRKRPHPFQFYSAEVQVDGFRIRNFHGVIHADCVERFWFAEAPLLIVENLETFVAIADLKPGIHLLLGGGHGAAALQFLKQVRGLGEVFYWGDLDKAGYEILGNVIEIFPQARAIGMGVDWLERLSGLHQKVSPVLPVLNLDDGRCQQAYERVCREGIRIEQEQAPISEVLAEMSSVI